MKIFAVTSSWCFFVDVCGFHGGLGETEIGAESDSAGPFCVPEEIATASRLFTPTQSMTVSSVTALRRLRTGGMQLEKRENVALNQQEGKQTSANFFASFDGLDEKEKERSKSTRVTQQGGPKSRAVQPSGLVIDLLVAIDWGPGEKVALPFSITALHWMALFLAQSGWSVTVFYLVH